MPGIVLGTQETGDGTSAQKVCFESWGFGARRRGTELREGLGWGWLSSHWFPVYY